MIDFAMTSSFTGAVCSRFFNRGLIADRVQSVRLPQGNISTFFFFNNMPVSFQGALRSFLKAIFYNNFRVLF